MSFHGPKRILPVLAVAGALLVSCKDDPTQAEPRPDAGGPANTLAAIRGLELYALHGCAACHCNAAEGGCNLDAPNVQGVDADGLEANLRFASTPDEFPDTPDPFDPHPYKASELSDGELEDLRVFLSTLSGGMPVANDSPIARGYQLYVEGTCIACHLMSAQGVNQGGLGQAIAGIQPDNLYAALAGGVPCHPVQNQVPTSSTGEPIPVCSLLGEYITDNPAVTLLTNTAPPDQDPERSMLSYFLAFISPPPQGGFVEPCAGQSGEMCTAAGNGIGGFTTDGVSATETLLYYPQNLELTDWNGDGSLDLVIVDWNNHRIRVVYLDREVNGISNLMESIAGDGRVTGIDALNHPTDVAFDPSGALVIATWHNQNLYRYGRGAPAGTERDQLAGLCDLKCAPEETGPSLAASTPVALPVAVESMADGRLIFAESACRRIRVLTVTGTATRTQPDQCIDPVRLFGQSTIQTLAGQLNQAGYEGDGGPALAAKFNVSPSPLLPNFGLSLGKGSNASRLYVADTLNNVIRVVDLSADPPTIALFAGTPGMAGHEDGPKEEARFSFPVSLYAAEDGSVYVVDQRNHAIRRIAPDGIVATVAGTGVAGFSGDNRPAVMSSLNTPSGVVVHPDGRIFISDTNNNRVRVVMP